MTPVPRPKSRAPFSLNHCPSVHAPFFALITLFSNNFFFFCNTLFLLITREFTKYKDQVLLGLSNPQHLRGCLTLLADAHQTTVKAAGRPCFPSWWCVTATFRLLGAQTKETLGPSQCRGCHF